MTFPRAVGQIPIHHDAENTGRPARTGGSMAADRWDVGLQGPNNLDDYYTSKFLDLERGPRFAFGHGLSYTTFRVEAASLSTSRISLDELRAGARVTVSVTVRNVGDRDGDDVVLVYLADPVAVARPAGAAPARLPTGRASPPGEAASVSFELGADELGFWDDEDHFVLEPGELVLTITDGTDCRAVDADRHARDLAPDLVAGRVDLGGRGRRVRGVLESARPDRVGDRAQHRNVAVALPLDLDDLLATLTPRQRVVDRQLRGVPEASADRHVGVGAADGR